MSILPLSNELPLSTEIITEHDFGEGSDSLSDEVSFVTAQEQPDSLSDEVSFVTAQEQPETVSREDHYALGGPQFPMRPPTRKTADAEQPLNSDPNRVQPLDVSRKFPLYHLFSGPATSAPTTVRQETVAGAGSDLIAVQQLTDGAIAGYTIFASRRIKQDYERTLSKLLTSSSEELLTSSSKEKLEKSSKDPESSKGISRSLGLAKMLTRTSEGKLQFDMEAVYQVARLEEYVDEPRKAHESRARLDAGEKLPPTSITTDAKNILLADYIAHDVHGKKHDRAAYEFIRTSVALATTGTFIAATHGASLIAEGAVHGLRTAGGIGVTAVSFRPDVMVRNTKFRYRAQKAARIENLHQEAIDRFAQENKDGFHVQGVGLRSLESVSEEAVRAVREGPMKENIVRQVNGERIGTLRLSASRVNEKKSTKAKAERRDFINKYAFEVLKHEMGVNFPDSISTFREILAESNRAGLRKQDASFRELIQKDPHLETAYRFLRDLGANEEGAIQCLRETMQAEVKKALSTDPRTALLSGTKSYDPKSAGASVVSRMRQAGASRGV
jgi:hypothetical protein